ncbi:MAG: DpnI domain-containing protein [bacterium]
MNLSLQNNLSDNYKSASQKIRVMSESWVGCEIFCPNCGANIHHYGNNRPVADFYCSDCKEDYELKSKKNTLGSKINDGAYSTMIERISSNNNPNFFLLNYDDKKYEVIDFLVIPKYFFIPKIIEERKPLSSEAKRHGWIGCNIIISEIPASGKIYYIKNKQAQEKNLIIDNWKSVEFLNQTKEIEAKGWLLDIMKCIDLINKKDFTLQDIYGYEDSLKLLHPNNNFIKDKIRQQLQTLRDYGYLKFLGNGNYRVVS